jgi:DNA-binding NtrC family response regulator
LTLGNRIDEGDIPDMSHPGDGELRAGSQSFADCSLTDRLAETEREYLVQLLERFGGSTELASAKAGLSLRTLQRKLKNHGIRPEKFKHP